MKKNKNIKIIILLSIILLIIDQASKIIVILNYKVPIEGKFFTISLIQNKGIAFGMNDGNNKNIALTVVVLLIVINFIVRQKDRLTILNDIAVSLILSGGMSNLMDRIFRGGVVDFIKVIKFAIFNIADCFIVFGWIMLVFFLIKEMIPNPFKQQNKKEVEDCEKS